MKKILFFTMLLLTLAVFNAKAQHVRVQLNFPGGYEVNAPRNAPYPNAVWVGPEWVWRHGRYVAVPGHWERIRRHRGMWVPGYWERRREGYIWIPGHWRR